MVLLTWPQFDFFEAGPITAEQPQQKQIFWRHADNGSTPHEHAQTPAKAAEEDDRPENERASFSFLPNLLKGQTLTCCGQGCGALLFGDHQGFVHLSDATLQVASFSAYSRRVSHLYQYSERTILLTIGEEEESPVPILKAWQLRPFLLTTRTRKAATKKNRGDGSESSSEEQEPPQEVVEEERILEQRRKAPILLKTIRLAESANKAWPVTAFTVCETSGQMAVALLNGTVLLIRGDMAKDRSVRQRVLHEEPQHLPVNAVCFRHDVAKPKEPSLFVVTPNHVHLYNTIGREQHEVLDDVGAAGKCVTIAPSPPRDDALILGRTDGIYFYGEEGRLSTYAFTGDKSLLCWYRSYLVLVGKVNASSSSSSSLYQVTLYDFKNKLIAHQETFEVDVRFVTWAWDTLFLVLQDGTMHAMTEKRIQSKLDVLFQQHLYAAALNLVQQRNGEPFASLEDQEAVTSQDSLKHHIHQRYGDHLYTKGEYDAAIQQYNQTIGSLPPSYVISRYLDPSRLKGLTSYLHTLHQSDAATPDHTTLLLHCFTKLGETDKLEAFIMTEKGVTFDVENAIAVCRQSGNHKQAAHLAKKYGDIDAYLKIQLLDANAPADALTYVAQLHPLQAQRFFLKFGRLFINAIPEEATKAMVHLCTDATAISKTEKALMADARIHPSTQFSCHPEKFIPLFVDHAAYLVHFLESVIDLRPIATTRNMWDTLLELYLKEPSASSRREAYRTKAAHILRNSDATYHTDHAIVLCRLFDFAEGMLYLYVKMKMYRDVIQHYVEIKDTKMVLDCCDRYADQEPDLWVIALRYVSQEEDLEEVQRLLEKMDRCAGLLPIEALKIMSSTESSIVGMVRPYLMKHVLRQAAHATEALKSIEEYRHDIDKMSDELRALHTETQLFHPGKCAICGTATALPAVYFGCRHAFHDHCLRDRADCPLCSAERSMVDDMQNSQRQAAKDQDAFFRQLDGHQDGFNVLTEFLGRNLFLNNDHLSL